MRRVLRIAMAVAAVLTSTVAVRALERTSVRADLFEREDWSTAGSCTVRYYNTCTGWIWAWSGWSAGEKTGTAFHGCCDSAVLQLTSHLTYWEVLSGWGYTGTIEVFAADENECPTGPSLAQQPWLPPRPGDWHDWVWNLPVPQDFLVRVNWGGSTGLTVDTALATDHPFAGPTGPTACGTCFPSDRTVHSYHWPVGAGPCAGEKLNDGLCDVEWMTEARLSCPVHVEEDSWGKIKTLYR